jgi:hypothetical protein
MPDDFQALPPPLPPNRPTSYEDRYAEVSFRKPEEEKSAWSAWVAKPLNRLGLAALLAGTAIFLALGFWLLEKTPPRPAPMTKTVLPPPLPAVPPGKAVNNRQEKEP